MKKSVILALSSCAMALTTAACSQTWVSNSGKDTGACPITAPCKTFAYAVTKTPAGGQLSVLDVGDYGPVTITQPMRIEGNGRATILATTGNAITVSIDNGVVQLHNLSVHGNGASGGINMESAGGLDIDNVQVSGFSGNCIQIASWSQYPDLSISNSTIENCGASGISFTPGAIVLMQPFMTIINSHVRFSHTGLSASNTLVTVANSSFSTGYFGVMATDSALVFLDNCQINGFGDGIVVSGASFIQASRSSFSFNGIALGLVNTYGAVVTYGSPNIGAGTGWLISNGNNSFQSSGYDAGTFSETVALQ